MPQLSDIPALVNQFGFSLVLSELLEVAKDKKESEPGVFWAWAVQHGEPMLVDAKRAERQ